MRTFRIYTVQGITANLKTLSAHFGVSYPLTHARMFKHDWTVEQALGVAPRPAPKPHRHRIRPALVDGPRLSSAEENFLRAVLTPLSAEGYLRLEGVPLNGHPLESRDE
ncbi:MAG: hypothetical protein JWO52_4110 [Gammaproteobacteria bacterium]|nr:hypothetical protein [Gammaproteobacteria bacterium]